MVSLFSAPNINSLVGLLCLNISTGKAGDLGFVSSLNSLAVLLVQTGHVISSENQSILDPHSSRAAFNPNTPRLSCYLKIKPFFCCLFILIYLA